jgi:chromosome segregation protein
MHLKSIILKGFKSFPDRTKLEFASGVSVVVGPNGSGKSNVTDAVLWALGEQSPLAVRGQSMQDVIFAGAPGRQAARAAEVELVLDDSAGTLGLGVPEVSIVRRLDRSGEGEYRLAGARCRLVDVIEVLSDTGLGKEMHSVISQGRVESLVTSKPRERRMLIEEAAGLGKHRKRRRRAHLKLLRTQENLDRALDVEREARSRLRPLKRQAEAAELHARIERQMLQARWELAREQVQARQQELEEAEGSARNARERRQQAERELVAVAKRREIAEEALARRSAERELLSRRLFIAQSASQGLAYRIDAVQAARESVQQRLIRAEASLEAISEEAEHDVPDGGSAARIDALQAALDALERDREAVLVAELAELERELGEAHSQTIHCGQLVEQRRSEREEAERRLELARLRLRQAERNVEAARREAARVGGELAAVNQFLSTRTNTAGAAGMLAERLAVDSGYELALAAALDGRLTAAIADDRAAAATLLDRAGSDGGRVLIAGHEPAGPGAAGSRPPVPEAERLVDRLQGSGAAGLAHTLLRDVWVVETLDQVPERFDGVAVTRDGRVWSAPTRELRQAPAAGEERILAERNRREQLIDGVEAAASAELGAARAVEEASQGLAEAEGDRDRAADEHRSAVRAHDEALEEERRISGQIERRRASRDDDGPEAARSAQLSAELAAERAAFDRAQRDRRERQARIVQLEAWVARSEALVGPIAQVLDALEAAKAAIGGQEARFEEALVADREAGDHLTTELRSCAGEEAALHSRLHGESEALTEAEVRVQRLRDQLLDVEQELRDLGARLELAPAPIAEAMSDEEREALRTRLERLARRREQLGPVNPLAQEEYQEAVDHVEELERQREDLDTALRELEKLIADTDRQIRETFEQTFAAAARNFEDVVARLFPGGQGRLRLVAEREGAPRVLGGAASADESVEDVGADEPIPEEDLLGVELEITPAGKEMKRLSLLSGGEKSMTALAFLFSVFLARPCPFYILDEVEAALDDLNIDRFLSLLREYSQRAQFIVVTHQKRTMEAADSLYGVSMGADGISKVISRRLPPERAAA